MKSNIFARAAATAAVLFATLSVTACNTRIKVDYGYDPKDYVELGQYKGLEAEIDEQAIEDELIEKRMMSDLDINTEYSEVSREAQEGDKVVVDFTGSVGGTAVSGFSNTDYEIILGTDTFVLDGFIDELYGMKAGDFKIITLQIPENFSDDTYAGNRIVYEITMKSVNQPIVPMITDAYVQEYLSYDSLEAYKSAIKASLQETIDEQIHEEKLSKVLSQLQDTCKVVDYPEEYTQQKREELQEYIDYFAIMMNMTTEQYCQTQFGISFDDYVKQNVAQSLILQAIIEEEDLHITEYQYKEELEQFAKSQGFTNKDTFTERYDKDTIVKGMLIEKAQSLVLENAVYK